MPTNPVMATYKRWDGTNWVEYHFRTNAGQVTTTSTRKFVTSSVTVNGVGFTTGTDDAASVTINGTHITSNATAPSGHSLVNISASDTIAAALGKLDKEVEDAKSALPLGVLTSGNYAATLDSVYLKSVTINGTAGSSFTLNGETLKYASSGDTTLKAAIDSKISGVKINGTTAATFNLNGETLPIAAHDATTIADAIDAIAANASGKTSSYVIDTSMTSGVYNKNGSFANQTGGSTGILEITISSSETNAFLRTISETNNSIVKFSDLKIGDNIFITDLNVPDWWLSDVNEQSNSTTYTFRKLETYNMAWGAISGKPTTLAGYGITDAKIQGGVITLGGNTITPLTQHQDISGKAPNNHAVNANTYGLGTPSVYGHVKLVTGDLNGKSAADGMAASQSHTHSQYLTSHQSLSGYATETWVTNNFQKKITVGSTEPSNKAIGDIWIATA